MIGLFLHDGRGMQLFFYFLTDSSFIADKIKYHDCGSDMHLIKRKRLADRRQWNCGIDPGSGCCNAAKSVMFNSLFTSSKLPIPIILQLDFEFFMGSSVDNINRDLCVHEQAMAD